MLRSFQEVISTFVFLAVSGRSLPHDNALTKSLVLCRDSVHDLCDAPILELVLLVRSDVHALSSVHPACFVHYMIV